ncbi:MAG: hypothetical protein LQ337_004451 [Flavoplaca oasis]|nr:MAG: hypothetical protein LQ337_004451 [Flavoplaca oasis]
MTSARSMLRDERANRRIAHRHLTYSTTGTLICQVCRTQIKTEALWGKHLESTQHTTNLQRIRESVAKAPALVQDSKRGNGSKKRKAEDDSSDDDTRKRTKGQDPSDLVERKESNVAFPDSTHLDHRLTKDRNQKIEVIQTQPPTTDPESKPDGGPFNTPAEPPDPPNNPIDEDEWAAFQREVASPPPETSAFTATADISAAPMTASELAAQSREEASRQAKERMEAAVEGEKEDAARQMEEELDEMAELEDRVRKLREKRELLRVQRTMEKGEDGISIGEKVPPDEVMDNNIAEAEEGSHDDTDDDDDDDDDNKWGIWGR